MPLSHVCMLYDSHVPHPVPNTHSCHPRCGWESSDACIMKISLTFLERLPHHPLICMSFVIEMSLYCVMRVMYEVRYHFSFKYHLRPTSPLMFYHPAKRNTRQRDPTLIKITTSADKNDITAFQRYLKKNRKGDRPKSFLSGNTKMK